MSPEAQRVAIAEACGAKWYLFDSGYYWLALKELKDGFTSCDRPDSFDKMVFSDSIPDYLYSLNACWKMTETLEWEERHQMNEWLYLNIPQDMSLWRVSPEWLCKGFLHIKKLWDDSK